jgi:hypothetical protein
VPENYLAAAWLTKVSTMNSPGPFTVSG